MALVLYSDSESDNDARERRPSAAETLASKTAKPTAKRKRSDSEHKSTAALPPLPAAFHDLYAANARVSTGDDPSLHGGRKRAVPHVEGNWPSHVYLEWVPTQAESTILHDLIKDIRHTIERANDNKQKPLVIPDITPSLLSSLGAPLPLHVSLSRTLQIKTEKREHFLQALTYSLRKAAVRPFSVRFSKLNWVSNFDQSRWFLILSIEKPAQDELNRLLKACNEAAEICGLPGLYVGGKGDGPMEANSNSANPKKRRKSAEREDVGKDATDIVDDHTEHLHVSIAWNLVEPDQEWVALVRDMDVTEYMGVAETSFDAVKAKIGNVVTSIDLGTKISGPGWRGGFLGVG